MAPLTGRKVLAIAVAFFGTIMTVNFVMAYQAIHTFPGLEVENGYVASQSFNVDMRAQKALGWAVKLNYQRRHLIVDFEGANGHEPDVATLDVLVGRPTEARDDQRPDFARNGATFTAPLELRPGRWMVVVQAKAGDGTAFRQRLSLYVPG